MALGIGSTSQQALSPLEQFQRDLLRPYEQATTGKRINSAADDPSGLAIATALQVQSSDFDQGSRNAFDARNALSVADGALQTTQDALQSLRSLAVGAANDFLSAGDRKNVQFVADTLVRQINSDAQNASFNGTHLLDGTFGSRPATAASATVTADAALAAGGTLASVVTAGAAAQGGTIGLTVVSSGGGVAVDVKFTDTATGTTADLGTRAAGATVTVNGTTLTLGNAAGGDVGVTATVQVQAASAGSSAPDAQVQTGANEGATTALALPDGSSAALFVQHIDLSSSASATNAVGQIDAALGASSAARASLGAQGVALGNSIDGNAIASNALTASASAISDANPGQTATELYRLLVQNQISLATLKNSNAQYGYLNRFFDTAG